MSKSFSDIVLKEIKPNYSDVNYRGTFWDWLSDHSNHWQLTEWFDEFEEEIVQLCYCSNERMNFYDWMDSLDDVRHEMIRIAAEHVMKEDDDN